MVVNSFVLVQGEGTQFDVSSSVVRGAGTFTLGAGASLGISSPQGISASGATGSIQVTGTRSFGIDSKYIYYTTTSGTTQVTGSGLPSQVRTLLCASGSTLALSQATSVSQRLDLIGGDLLTDGHP